MGRKWRVFVDLQFVGRLNKGSDDRKAEVMVLVENIRDFGLDTLRLAGYCTVTGVRLGGSAIAWINFEFKTRGGWTPLKLEVRQPHVAVIYDR